MGLKKTVCVRSHFIGRKIYGILKENEEIFERLRAFINEAIHYLYHLDSKYICHLEYANKEQRILWSNEAGNAMRRTKQRRK